MPKVKSTNENRATRRALVSPLGINPIKEKRKAQKKTTEEYQKEQVKNLAKRAPRIAQPIALNSMGNAGGGSELTDIGLSELAYTMFGKTYVEELISKKIIDGPRDIWELSSPTTQCENIIGKATGETRCWICNLPIQDNVLGLTPECEHVLPIAQAILYMGLFSVSAVKKIFPTEMFVLPGMKSEALKLEYRWAHRVCNQVKNDDSYLDYNSATGKYFVREDKIRDLLKRIKTNTRSYGKDIKPILIDLSGGSAIQVFEAVCTSLNNSNAPALLEFAGLISAGYGPRKVGVNRDLTPISEEERISNMRKEIIKSNIEYSGVVQKTIEKLSALPRIGSNAGSIFLKIVENRRPEYVSLFMRIKPTQSNMNHLIAYIRQQLLSEFAAVDATVLGIEPTRRNDANTVFRQIVNPLLSTINIKPSPEFNQELMKANNLYQKDSSIGDTIRTILEEYKHTELPDAIKNSIQIDLSNELIETSDAEDPINRDSEYAQMLENIKFINTSSLTDDIGTIASDPTDSWVDNSDKLVSLLNSTEQWTADEKDVAEILTTLNVWKSGGGNRRYSRRNKRTRKVKKRRT